MNIENAEKFINDHKDKVIGLFITYQMIEMFLFLKLHLPGLPKEGDRADAMGAMNKQMNCKTLGKLKRKYLEKFPEDDYDLESDLKTVTDQRNSFMHSIWMVIASGQDAEEATRLGEVLINDFGRRAGNLLDKIYKLPA